MNNEHKLRLLEAYSNKLLSTLESITWLKDLTNEDNQRIKSAIEDIKETIEDVEFSLFTARSNKNFIEANKELEKL